MSKMMILGVKGEKGLWLVDFAAGTVTAVDGNKEDYLAGTNSSETEADVAVAFEPREAAFSGLFFKTPDADVAAIVEPEEPAFSGLFFKTPDLDVAVTVETEDPAFSGLYYKTPPADIRPN